MERFSEEDNSMGKILGSFILPHPPVIVPEVGKGNEAGAAETIMAVKDAAADIAAMEPTTVILTTPHGTVFSDFVYISDAPELSGDFGRFGAKKVRLGYENNTQLVSFIVRAAALKEIPCGGLEESIARKFKVSGELDHGALVPLYFLSKAYNKFKLVHVSMSMLPFEALYKFGQSVQEAVEESDEQVVFIASGDLSHRLSADAPYGFSKKGAAYDRMLVDCFSSFEPEKLLQVDEGLCDEVGECGLRSFIMMFGALDGYKVEQKLYSYEGPFGVGYSVAGFRVIGKGGGSALDKYLAENKIKLDKMRQNEDPYVGLARKTLETYVEKGRIITLPEGLPEEMTNTAAGVFVSIKRNGQLRGCIGTIYPARKCLAEEIIQNAISSGTQDPRFDAVRKEELPTLVYSVDVLKEPEPIESMSELDVERYGVIVRSGRRSGLLLPNLEGIDDPEKQVSIALQKAGIGKGENYKMERFEVIRHKQEPD